MPNSQKRQPVGGVLGGTRSPLGGLWLDIFDAEAVDNEIGRRRFVSTLRGETVGFTSWLDRPIGLNFVEKSFVERLQIQVPNSLLLEKYVV